MLGISELKGYQVSQTLAIEAVCLNKRDTLVRGPTGSPHFPQIGSFRCQRGGQGCNSVCEEHFSTVPVTGPISSGLKSVIR